MGDSQSLSGITDVLGQWAEGEGPLYRRLAERIRAAIAGGQLSAGTMLPPERQLAEAMAVSRSTVVSAFEDLKRSGHLEARQGSGTWVRGRVRPADEGNVELVEQL